MNYERSTLLNLTKKPKTYFYKKSDIFGRRLWSERPWTFTPRKPLNDRLWFKTDILTRTLSIWLTQFKSYLTTMMFRWWPLKFHRGRVGPWINHFSPWCGDEQFPGSWIWYNIVCQSDSIGLVWQISLENYPDNKHDRIM